MTNTFVQTIPDSAVDLIFYVKDRYDCKSLYDEAQKIQNLMNKPVIICINDSLEILNHEDLKRFGLQKVEINEDIKN